MKERSEEKKKKKRRREAKKGMENYGCMDFV